MRDLWERRISGKGNSQRKGPEVEVCLVCVRMSQGAGVAGDSRVGEKVGRLTQRCVGLGGRVIKDLVDFPIVGDRNHNGVLKGGRVRSDLGVHRIPSGCLA